MRGDLRGGIALALVPGRALAGDRLQPAIGEFGLARDRLRFDRALRRARRGRLAIVVVDLGELGFEIGGGGQRRERLLRFAARGVGLVAAGADALLGLVERRNARRIAADLALGGGMFFARGIGRALRLAPARARLGLGRRRRGERGFGRFDHAPLGFDFAARGGKFAFDRLQAGRARQAGAPRRSARARRRQSRPSARNRPSRETSRWPGLSVAAKPRPVGALDDADLREPARQFRRRLAQSATAAATPSGSAGSDGSSAAPAQCIGAD